MRTTVATDDELLARAKKRASDRGLTLGSFVEEALREHLSAPPRTPMNVDFPITSSARLRDGIDPTSNRALYAALDEGAELRA